MTKLTKMTLLLAAIVATCVWQPVSAQDFDDIYYNPDKVAKAKKNTKSKTPVLTTGAKVTTGDYAAADTYAPSTQGLNVDVDTYNRRGMFAPIDSVTPAQSIQSEDFAYTRRIEKYHNSDIVSGSQDDELQAAYYATQTQQPTEINVYVIETAPSWTSWWGSPYWSYSYYDPWNWGYYRPYYNWRWDWTWGWGYNPYYDWGWGWGPAGYYPGLGYNWGWGWSYPTYWRPNPPSTGPGSSRPHRPSYASNNDNRRPGSNISGNLSSSNRPGNMGRGRYNATTTTSRPGSVGSLTGNRRPAGSLSQPSSQINSGNASATTVGNGSIRPAGTTTLGRGRNASTGVSRPATQIERSTTVENNSSRQTRVSRQTTSTPSFRSSGSSSGRSSGSSSTRSSGGGGSRGRH